MAEKTKELNKPHILIYAHYYYPDVASTGQILRELAEGLLDDFHVTVICVIPSYGGMIASEYRKKKYYFEIINGVDVIRVRVPEFDKTRKISRVKNILTYFFRAIWATEKVMNVDYVYSISQPPILGGMLGVWGKWLKHAKYIYNIQDFNPEQIKATGYSKSQVILNLMLWIDKFSCKRADKVIIVGRDMVGILKMRFKGEKVPSYTFINNWIDEKEIYPLELTEPHVAAFRKEYGLENKFVFMYSGNLGLYYDLENLMKVIKKFSPGTKTFDGRNVMFTFIGDGSIRNKLLQYKMENRMENVIFIPYQDKAVLNYSLNAADVHWCVSAHGIKGVSVPSKIYGCCAVGKPVLGVMETGAEARLILEEVEGGLVCEPQNYEQIEKNIQWYIDHAGESDLVDMGKRNRKYLIKNLTKDVSVKKYIADILEC